MVSHHLGARGFKDMVEAAAHLRSRARGYHVAHMHLQVTVMWPGKGVGRPLSDTCHRLEPC